MTVTMTPEMAEVCLRALTTEQHRLGSGPERLIAKHAQRAIEEALSKEAAVKAPEEVVDDTNPIGPIRTGRGW